MTDIIRVRRKNWAYLEVDAEPSVLAELREHFSFMVPGYQYMPAYRNGTWDGKIRLLDWRARTLYHGLYDKVLEFANAKGRDYSVVPEMNDYFGMIGSEQEVDRSEIEQFISDLTLTGGGKPITPHDYQVDAVVKAINEKRLVLLSPTASGKSLIIYLTLRWILAHEHEHEGRKIALIVPTTSLVKQMYGDFEDYSEFDEGFDVSDHCHMLYSGKEKKFQEQVLITTWQSFIKFPKTRFQQFGAIFGDEAHTFKAKSLATIMENMVNASWRVGTTGTLDGIDVNILVLTGLFGPVHRVISTKKLMDEGRVSNLDIKVLMLQYPEDLRKGASKASYHDEISFINNYKPRNEFIKKLALDQDGNTLVTFRMVEHGKKLYEMISESAHKKRKIFFVAGETDVDTREEVRKITEKETDAIIIASLGVFSTGINIKNLHNIIFAAPKKSQVKVLQSIGRGLRLSDDGRTTTLYDIADDLHWKKRRNYTLNHAAERLKMYASEKFKFKVYEIPIGNRSK